MSRWSVSSRMLALRGLRWTGLGLMPTAPILILLILAITAILAPVLTPFDPVRHDLLNNMMPPAWVTGGTPEHTLGTDGFGRDVFARLIYGTRASLTVAAFSLTIAVLIGTTAGVTAGFVGGWVDTVIMRLVDVVLSLPTILVALTLAIALGPSFRNLVLVLGFLIWPRIARLIRGETLLLRRQDFVRYAKAIGVPSYLIIVRHIIPNILPTLLVAITLEIGHVILLEASLSFLGAGLPPPTPSWGVMINDGRGLIATGWWIATFPGLAIAVTVLSFNMLGDWLRDALDPKFRRV